MTNLLPVLNSASVGLFGAFLAASFCDLEWSKKQKGIFVLGILFMGVLQGILFLYLDTETMRKIYPLIAHLPLTLILWYLSKKGVWSLISVFTAYLCCQLRRWLALFAVLLLKGDSMTQELIELFLTVPLLLLILSLASPAVKSLSPFPLPLQIQFGVLPAVGYVFDYLTRIYTDWLIVGAPLATEFMLFVCAIAQLVFARYSNAVLRRQRENEQTRVVLDLQLKQSAKQIAAMQQSQKLAAQYRHDLRHHLQYLSSCIENDRIPQAQEYITTLNDSIVNQKVTTYCANTAVNLILSSFVAQAKEADVPMTIRLRMEETLRVSENDLCVLLSNALENALHACVALKAQNILVSAVSIELRGYTENGKLFLEISNSCTEHIPFVGGLPVTHASGHGIGVKSICSIVEKYDGLYAFSVKDSRFVLRVSL